MSGNQMIGSVGTVGLGWKSIPLPASIGSLGLLSYGAVSRLQQYMNQVVAHSGTTSPCSIRSSAYTVGTDGVWDDQTQTLFERIVKFYADGCSLPGYPAVVPANGIETIRNFGPRYFSDVLKSRALGVDISDADIATYQRAWYEYKASKSGSPDPDDTPGTVRVTPVVDTDAAAAAACAASGGRWDGVAKVCLPATSGDSGEGMGTGMWILLFVIGGLTAYGIYYAATE